MVELVRGWQTQHAPEATGQIRLSKAAFYRDVELPGSGLRDEKEGKASALATTSVSRDDTVLSDTTVELDLDDGEEPTVVHLPRRARQASVKQIVPVDIHPVPYVFCASRKPDTLRGLQTLRNTINPGYDAWYAIRDSDALGRELEKAIKGWLFDRRVNSHTLYRLYDWVHYYDGDRPPIIADLDEGVGERLNGVLDLMKLWFNKRARYRDEQEYRYAYVLESPELTTLPTPSTWTLRSVPHGCSNGSDALSPFADAMTAVALRNAPHAGLRSLRRGHARYDLRLSSRPPILHPPRWRNQGPTIQHPSRINNHLVN